ncbi:uncharacterized protein VTP21DRAFT_11516 [Calcarisporiella thermophila]|uniref:uncharacterized protein n=1 Tax=Calcarisporiella thermophila TaxID=911321 RepID=UPI0037423CA9
MQLNAVLGHGMNGSEKPYLHLNTKAHESCGKPPSLIWHDAIFISNRHNDPHAGMQRHSEMADNIPLSISMKSALEESIQSDVFVSILSDGDDRTSLGESMMVLDEFLRNCRKAFPKVELESLWVPAHIHPQLFPLQFCEWLQVQSSQTTESQNAGKVGPCQGKRQELDGEEGVAELQDEKPKIKRTRSLAKYRFGTKAPLHRTSARGDHGNRRSELREEQPHPPQTASTQPLVIDHAANYRQEQPIGIKESSGPVAESPVQSERPTPKFRIEGASKIAEPEVPPPTSARADACSAPTVAPFHEKQPADCDALSKRAAPRHLSVMNKRLFAKIMKLRKILYALFLVRSPPPSISPASRGEHSPKPFRPDHFHRYPIQTEYALYKLSHLKLSEQRRPLRHQVIITNFMFWYLSTVQKQITRRKATPQASLKPRSDSKASKYGNESTPLPTLPAAQNKLASTDTHYPTLSRQALFTNVMSRRRATAGAIRHIPNSPLLDHAPPMTTQPKTPSRLALAN